MAHTSKCQSNAVSSFHETHSYSRENLGHVWDRSKQVLSFLTFWIPSSVLVYNQQRFPVVSIQSRCKRVVLKRPVFSTTYLARLAGDFVLCVFPFVVRKVGRIQPREGWTDVNETISHPLPPLRYPRYLARFGLTQSSWVTLLLNHFDKQKTHQKWQASDLFNLHSKGRQQIVVARNIIIHTDNRQ